MADSRSFLANQKARNAIVGAENLLRSDKIANERLARVGYNHFISNKDKWNNCFSKFSNQVLPPIFISTILQSVRKEKLGALDYFPYDVKFRQLAHSWSFLANQKARNAIVGAENLLIRFIPDLKVCFHLLGMADISPKNLVKGGLRPVFLQN